MSVSHAQCIHHGKQTLCRSLPKFLIRLYTSCLKKRFFPHKEGYQKTEPPPKSKIPPFLIAHIRIIVPTRAKNASNSFVLCHKSYKKTEFADAAFDGKRRHDMVYSRPFRRYDYGCSTLLAHPVWLMPSLLRLFLSAGTTSWGPSRITVSTAPSTAISTAPTSPLSTATSAVASSLTVVASAVSLNLVETVVGLYWVGGCGLIYSLLVGDFSIALHSCSSYLGGRLWVVISPGLVVASRSWGSSETIVSLSWVTRNLHVNPLL